MDQEERARTALTLHGLGRRDTSGPATFRMGHNKFHPFLPAIMNRSDILRWLKRVHAWTGFWGAVAFLLLGVSGFLLNHKSVAKIDTGAPKEVSSVILPVTPSEITTIEQLGAWAQKTFGTQIKPRLPRVSSTDDTIRFMGRDIKPTDVWRQRFYAPNAILLVEYVPGSSSVKATTSAQNGWGVIKNLHKASGMGIMWVLFFDSMAGALIMMTMTGALLWSQLHGPRLLAIGIVLASVMFGLLAAVPRFL